MAAATCSEADTVLGAWWAMRGFVPPWRPSGPGSTLALANKETLVAAGSLVMDAVKKAGSV